MSVIDAALPVAAAINALMLAAALAVQSWRKRAAAGLYASAYLAVAAAAIALIAIDHSRPGPPSTILPLIEGSLTFASGPLFLLFAAASLGVSLERRAFLGVLVVLAAGAIFLNRWYSPPYLADRLVFVQMAFTAAAAVLVILRHRTTAKVVRSHQFVISAIAVLAALHAAQLVRTFWPDLELTRNIVPAIGAVGLLALSMAVYFGGRLGLLEHLTDAPAVATDGMRELVARVEAALAAGLLKRADLTSADAAAAAGVSPEQLTEAVRSVTGGGFPARLQQLRVEEALRLLADPKEARTSMEAIGLLAGFGSRSAFYQAFGERVGMSPAAYRKSLAAKPVQKTETGQI